MGGKELGGPLALEMSAHILLGLEISWCLASDEEGLENILQVRSGVGTGLCLGFS